MATFKCHKIARPGHITHARAEKVSQLRGEDLEKVFLGSAGITGAKKEQLDGP